MAIIISRTVIIYFALILTMRLLGKRQLGEMELSEFVTAALIADLAAHPLQDIGIPMLNGLVPVFVLFCFEVLIAGATMKSIRLRTLFFGKPSILISHGVINQLEMRKNRFTVDELMQELRNQSCLDISQIEYAILETDGKLNIFLNPSERPATAAQLNIEPAAEAYPFIVISDGRILEANLRHIGFDLPWLYQKISEQGYTGAKDVFLMTANSSGQIFSAGKEVQR